MATVKRGILTRSPQWWRHLRDWKRIFWKKERKAAQDKLIAIRNDALTNYKLEGTPTFGINGVAVPGVYDWASLEPKLQAALK